MFRNKKKRTPKKKSRGLLGIHTHTHTHFRFRLIVFQVRLENNGILFKKSGNARFCACEKKEKI